METRHTKRRSRAGKIYSSRDVPSDGNNTQVKYAPIESKIDEMVVVGYAPEGTTVPEEGTVFEVVEQMPEYPGGMSAMMEFIGKISNIR